MKKQRILLAVALVVLLAIIGSSSTLAQERTPDDPQDNLIFDDLIVDGSLCVGFDCIEGELFEFDTLILKENNLRIYFRDTSTSSAFPTNDWRITINDSMDGGASFFRIDDVDAAESALTILAGGNVGLGTDTPTEKLHVEGNVYVSGSVTEMSDLASKENIASVNGHAILDLLAGVPISTWNYKFESPEVRHLGPMAQDFYKAFGLGADETRIASLDTSGVALAAIQELNLLLKEKETQIEDLQAQNVALEARLAVLEGLMEQLVQE
jgi:hypothetical protein